MTRLIRHTLNFFKSEDGPTAVEYSVLIAIICIGVIVALSGFGDHLYNIYTDLTTGVDVF